MTRTLYFSNTGRVACAEHGGSYLKAALELDPNAQQIRTPLDVWDAMRMEDLPLGDLLEPWCSCEECGASLVT